MGVCTTGVNVGITLSGNFSGTCRVISVQEVIHHGANIDGVQYFQTTNGNSVTNNVVTEAVGRLLTTGDFMNDADGPLGYTSESAATNALLWSRDFTEGSWEYSGYGNREVEASGGMDGGSFIRLNKTADNGFSYSFINTVVPTTGTNTVFVYMRKANTEAYFPSLKFSWGTTAGIRANINITF